MTDFLIATVIHQRCTAEQYYNDTNNYERKKQEQMKEQEMKVLEC